MQHMQAESDSVVTCDSRMQSLTAFAVKHDHGSDLQEGLEHPVTPQRHRLEVHTKQAVDELGVGAVVGSHTHRALEHPRCAEPRVVCIDGGQRLLIQSLSLCR